MSTHEEQQLPQREQAQSHAEREQSQREQVQSHAEREQSQREQAQSHAEREQSPAERGQPHEDRGQPHADRGQPHADRGQSQRRHRITHRGHGLPHLGHGRHAEEMPRMNVTRRRALLFAAFVLAAIAFLYVVLPQLGGVQHTWNRIKGGDAWWIAVAVVMEVLSLISYIAIFQGVAVAPGSPITWRESYEVTMAGLAATRLFAAGGAGGVAVTAWALRRSGMERREVAERMIAFLVLLYGVYMAAMVVCGVGLYVGAFPGRNPFAITIGPAIFAAVVILVFLAIAFVPEDFRPRLGALTPRNKRVALWVERVATSPAYLSGGIHFAWHKLRRPDWAMIGTVSWWGFNIAVLYAAFRAFGKPPPVAVLIQAYFVGLLANLLPLPGGIGGVDGGMIGALVAFGVGGSLALIAVLVYRLFAFWLPTIPGAVAYFQLRRTVHRWDEDLPRHAALAGGSAPA